MHAGAEGSLRSHGVWLLDADVSAAGVDVIVRLFPTPWAEGSQTQVVIRDTEPPATGTRPRSHPSLAGRPLARNTLLSSPQFLPMSSTRFKKRCLSKQRAVPELPDPDDYAQPPGPDIAQGGHRLQAGGPGVRGACSRLSGSKPWRQSPPAAGPREGSPPSTDRRVGLTALKGPPACRRRRGAAGPF